MTKRNVVEGQEMAGRSPLPYSFLQAGAYDCTHASPMIRTTPAGCIIQTCTRDSSRPTDRASARGKRAMQRRWRSSTGTGYAVASRGMFSMRNKCNENPVQ